MISSSDLGISLAASDSAVFSTPVSRPAVNPWLIAVVVSLAAFMEVLDTSIANVALPHIAGDLGASNDESTWVLTSYLVSNAIVLPISGWFVGLLGRKRFFLLCILLFTISSLLSESPLVSASSWSHASCKARAAADYNRWRKPSWPTPFPRRNVAWPFRSTG
jgi:MFS family permease